MAIQPTGLRTAPAPAPTLLPVSGAAALQAAMVAAAPAAGPVPASDPAPWEAAVRVLAEAGIRRVFGLPDDDMASQRALEEAGIEAVWTTSQRSAVHMAAGAALADGTVSVCVIGRGPAVAAAVPGLLEASYAGAPVVVLAAGTGPDRLEDRAFQDAPTLEMTRPVTKWSVRIPAPHRTAELVRSALARAAASPSGPVFVEVPDPAGNPPAEHAGRHSVAASAEAIRDRLARAERPVVVLGAGAAGVPGTELLDLARRTGAAVLATASGRGSFPESHPRYLGLAGLYMSAPVAGLLREADALVAVGSRLEETALEGMPLDAEWIQVNVNAGDIVQGLRGLHQVRPAESTAILLPEARPRPDWDAAVQAVRTRLIAEAGDLRGSRCAAVLRALSAAVPPSAVVVHENGLHDIWSYAFPHFVLPDGAVSVAPSEQTTLGFGVAAAAGIAVEGGPLVVCIAGDTALSTLRPDLDAVLESRRPLLYVVFDDGGMGWLDRQAREAGVERRFSAGPRPSGPVQGPQEYVLQDAEAAGDAVAAAVARARSGRPTVLRVPCAPEDIAPLLRSWEVAP